MTSSLPIKTFLLISLQNRYSEQKLSTREPENFIIQILSSMSSKTTSRYKIKVAVAMATREMAIAPPIFYREIKNFAQICTLVCTIILLFSTFRKSHEISASNIKPFSSYDQKNTWGGGVVPSPPQIGLIFAFLQIWFVLRFFPIANAVAAAILVAVGY